MSKPIFIMLDTETTSLNTREALPWQVGFIVFDSNFHTILTYSGSSPLPTNLWDAGTLDWAKNTYGDEYLAEHAAIVTDNAADRLCLLGAWGQMISEVMNALQMVTTANSKENVYLICNHVEFDWSVLLNAQAKAGITKNSFEKIIHYRNKLDLQSLCIGSACARGYSYSAMYKDFKAYMASCGKDKVVHRAVEDCESQIEMLRFFFDSLDALVKVGD